MPTITAPVPTLRVSYAGSTDAPSAFRQAFEFLQRHGEGRYSDRTLMAINRWASRCEDYNSSPLGTNLGSSYERLPGVFSLASETSYDEETEVKFGGMCAVAVTLPTEVGDSRLVLAVAPESRRKGYGRRLLTEVYNYESANFHAWVGQGNIDGIKFLLEMGMFPQEMNSQRAILFARRARAEIQEGVAQ